MEAIPSFSSVSFGEQHFGACDLGDKRLNKRVIFTANRMLEHPGGTLPDKLKDSDSNADLVGLYRLANNPKVTHAKLMAAHCQRTRDLIAMTTGVVLIIHDTTELDFSGLDIEQMGPIGNGGCRGYLCHNSLAYDYQAGEVLGLANQTLHVRRRVPKQESPTAKRDHPDRESRLWKKGWTALGPAPEGCVRVNIADRGADLFEFIEAVDRNSDRYCIRSKSNRNIELSDGQGGVSKVRLHDWARQLPTLGTRVVSVQANHGQKARTATVRVAAGAISIKAPHFARGEHSQENLRAWVVYVCEVDPPKNSTPLEWILLTNSAAVCFERACERIDWYACRPIIEEFHKAQKTGCGIELPQFTTGAALQVPIALLSVVATQLLRLRDLSRREDAVIRPARQVMDPIYVNVLSAWRYKEVRAELSVHDFCLALAKLGGHLNRKHDKPSGWLVLWRGWTTLQLLVEGAEAGAIAKCV